MPAAPPIRLIVLDSPGFMVSMLDEGPPSATRSRSRATSKALGAGFGSGTARDGSTLSVRSLKQNASKTLGILSDLVMSPSFPDKEVERVRSDRLTSLQQDRDSPFRIASTVMWTDLYGSSNPYGHMAIGTEPGLKTATRDDLVKLYQAALSPKNAALVLAGDLTESEARRLAEEAFGKWSADGRPPLPEPKAGSAPAPEKVLVVDRPSLPQTTVMVAQVGVARSNPDYERLNVMNQVLGGLFSSRVNMNLREEHGYTYGAFSRSTRTGRRGRSRWGARCAPTSPGHPSRR